MSAREFQLQAKQLLEQYFEDVRIEWPAAAEAINSARQNEDRYTPRLDIAVGPFNASRSTNSNITEVLIDPRLSKHFTGLTANSNPRCLIAIEVTYSGSSKHILGDILNASVLGLYGIVVCQPDLKSKVERNIAYLKDLAELGNLPARLFGNVIVMDTDEFKNALR